MLLPIVQLILLYSINGTRRGMKLAVVNDELQDFTECFETFNSSTLINGKCTFEKASCLYLNGISDNIDKRFYGTFDEGYQHLKHGPSIVFLYIKKNFTDLFNEYLEKKSLQDPFAVFASATEIHIDRTDWCLSETVINLIKRGNYLFLRLLLASCEKSDSFLNSPLTFMEPDYGSLHWNHRTFLANTLIALQVFSCFFLSIC